MSKKKVDKGGRPPTVTRRLETDELKKVMQFRPTVADVAGWFDCSKRAVQKFIETHHKMTFMEYREHCMAGVKLKLIQIAIGKALSGKDNEMLKYCLNNLAGWSYNPLPKEEMEEIEDMVF